MYHCFTVRIFTGQPIALDQRFPKWSVRTVRGSLTGRKKNGGPRDVYGGPLQEELIGLSTNEELKVQIRKGYQQFWLQKDIPVAYPVLWAIARKFLIAFPSSYLVERGFSAVNNFLTKKRNRLQITERGD
ncbi:SCAN domain-containing protein 3-like [Arctopsyche grandis]|uniref:SCAN domain-containing protein 3-like n=1 Tax=Arctopsyche grandis TaxID=121162 RepID=UPI00406D913F